jgi:hypothetical protein
MLGMRLALWTLLAIFLLFLVVDWGTSTPTPGKCEQYDSASKEHSDPKQCASLRSTVFEGAEPVVYQTARWFDVHNGTVTGIATVFLAIITAWLVFVARDQSNTTRAQLRAYVFVSGARIVHGITDNNILEAHIEIKNSGQTPAYKLTSVCGLAFDTYPPPQSITLTVPDQDYLSLAKTQMVLGPGDKTFPIARERPLTSIGKANLVAGTMAIWVYGEIRYRDAFRREQWTKYRLIIGGPFGVSGGQLTACEEGNEGT